MKVCAVTGAAAGIGHATAIGLAKAGTHVVAVVRDAVRGEATVQAIRAASGSAEVSLLVCDLSSQQSIRDAAAELGRRHSQLDVLVNQAACTRRRARSPSTGSS